MRGTVWLLDAVAKLPALFTWAAFGNGCMFAPVFIFLGGLDLHATRATRCGATTRPMALAARFQVAAPA